MFPLRGSLIKKKIQCYVLFADDTTRLKTQGGKFSKEEDKGYSFRMQNGTISNFLNPFESVYFFDIPVVDETNFKGHFDIDLKTKMSNIDSVNEALRNYGLKFIKAEREMEALVLKEILE